jgi:hypothetical protein
MEKHFNSVIEIADCVDDGDDYEAMKHDQRFAGASWSESLRLAREGWTEGTAEVLANLDNIAASDSHDKEWRWDVVGEMFDVGEYMTGNPEHWLEQAPQPDRKTHKVVANVTASGGVNAESMRMKGAAVLALVEKLQEMGHIVELHIVTGVELSGEKHEVWLHCGMTPMDMDAVSFALAHPAFFRRLTWAAMNKMTGKHIGGGFCHDVEPGEDAIYIPSGDLRREGKFPINDSESAAKWVAGVIEQRAA